jgi:hypothetical protein
MVLFISLVQGCTCLIKKQNGRAMAQVVSRRPLTAEARARARVNPCGIFGGQSGPGTGFSPSSSVFPCQYIIPLSPSKLISSGECPYANIGRHPGLGIRPTPPSGKEKHIRKSGASISSSRGDAYVLKYLTCFRFP